MEQYQIGLIVGGAVLLVVIIIVVIKNGTADTPPPPMVQGPIGSWPTDEWMNANYEQAYRVSDESIEDCRLACSSDRTCNTMLGFQTYSTWPKRPCRLYKNKMSASDQRSDIPAWYGMVDYR